MQDFGRVVDEQAVSGYIRRFTAGQVIYREGDEAEDAFMLQQGRVRLTKKVHGVERGVSVLQPGDVFGESALLSGVARGSTAVALSDVAALAFDRSTLHRVLEGDASTAAQFVEQLVKRLRDAEDQVEIMFMRDNHARTVTGLLKLAQRNAIPEGAALLTITPVDLATRVGLDVDAVKRSMQKLRDSDYVRVIGERINIPDIAALQRLLSLLAMKEEIAGVNPPEGGAPRRL